MSELKKCSKCKEIKNTSFFYKNKSKSMGISNQCKDCCKKYEKDNEAITLRKQIYLKEYNKKNKEKIKEVKQIYYKKYLKEYRRKNKEKIINSERKNRDKNREKINNRVRLNAKKNAITLSDTYIKDIISNKNHIKHSDIPIELIELKRSQILLTREIRKQNENHK
jgi:hypothetical protein